MVKIQNDLGTQIGELYLYAAVFETVNSVFGGNISNLPTDQETIDFIYATITTHLTDGAKMLTRVVNWLEKNPAYYRNFFTGNWGDHSGCIPKRNVMLSNWIDANIKNQQGNYIYDTFIILKCFNVSVGMLMDLFRQNCFINIIKGNISLVYAPDDAFEKNSIFNELYTKENFIKWVKTVVRNAYQSKGYGSAMPAEWNNDTAIGAVWDAVLGNSVYSTFS